MSVGYTLHMVELNEQADAGNPGVRLGRFCIAEGWSVAQVAEELGVSRTTVYNWFCDAMTPSVEMAAKIEDFITEHS